MMKKILLLLFQAMLLMSSINLFGQGYNHAWLIGNELSFDTNTTAPKARILFDSQNADTIGEVRKMSFYETQANISDANGNLIAATNGCWIMGATGDTMQNGNGLSPGSFVNSYCTNTSGIPLPHGALFIPYPGDSSKYILFHQVGNFNANLESTELFYSVIDINLNGGLGGVIPSQKNLTAFSDTLSWGFAACKHANGRDWWVLAIKDTSKFIYKVLVTPSGIASVTTQIVNMPLPYFGNSGQPCFSPDGSKFAYRSGKPNNPTLMDFRVFSFNRCTGQLDSIGYVYKPGIAGFGLSFSPNSRYLYYSSFGQVFQLDTDAPDIAATDTLVATYDGYCYPYSFSCTNFWLMYRAANGKIYITSSQYVVDLHTIDSPDSAGVSCNVLQHSLRLPSYSIYGNVNHPNYYLGCDTTLGCPCLITGINNLSPTDFKFRIYPNPVTSNSLHIGYLLPVSASSTSASGLFQIYDVTGKVVFKYPLPQWSNEQSFKLPQLADGVYNAVIISGNQRVSKTIAVIKQ